MQMYKTLVFVDQKTLA